MSLLSNHLERFWNYVSPRRTQERREKPFKTPALPSAKPQAYKKPASSTTSARASSGRHSMSPRSRVQKWKIASGNSYAPQSRAPFATPSIGRATPPLDTSYLELEGDTLMADIEEEEENGKQDYEEEDVPQYDVGDETMVDEEYNLKEEHIIDVEEEQRKWAIKAEDMRMDGWSDDAIEIYVKIGMRGQEPLLPASWKWDFPTFLSPMFSQNDDEVFIKSASRKEFRDFHGAKALNDLLYLGRSIRDARDNGSHRGPEAMAIKGCNKYLRWALKDGGVDLPSDIPLLAFEAGGLDKSTTELQKSMTLKLSQLGDRYRERLQVLPSTEDGFNDAVSNNPPSEAEIDYTHPLPTLYGIVASNTALAFVCYDVAADQPGMRVVGMFDFDQARTDVWNSIAIAEFVIHARNGMMRLQPYTKTGDDDEEYEDEDPDA